MHDRAHPASSIGRRGFLRSAVAFGAIASSGAAWWAWRSVRREAWIESVVRKHLPAIDLDAESLAHFARKLAQHRTFEDWRNVAAWRLDRALPGIARSIGKSQQRIVRLERLVVCEFLMGSNFFRVPDPRRVTIVYRGEIPACGNPFAVFRDE